METQAPPWPPHLVYRSVRHKGEIRTERGVMFQVEGVETLDGGIPRYV